MLASLTWVSLESFGRTLSDSQTPFSAGATGQFISKCSVHDNTCTQCHYASTSLQVRVKRSEGGCTIHVHLIISIYERIVKVSHRQICGVHYLSHCLLNSIITSGCQQNILAHVIKDTSHVGLGPQNGLTM